MSLSATPLAAYPTPRPTVASARPGAAGRRLAIAGAAIVVACGLAVVRLVQGVGGEPPEARVLATARAEVTAALRGRAPVGVGPLCVTDVQPEGHDGGAVRPFLAQAIAIALPAPGRGLALHAGRANQVRHYTVRGLSDGRAHKLTIVSVEPVVTPE